MGLKLMCQTVHFILSNSLPISAYMSSCACPDCHSSNQLSFCVLTTSSRVRMYNVYTKLFFPPFPKSQITSLY